MPRKQNFKVTSFIVNNASTPTNSQHSILTNSTSPETCKDVESLLSRKEDKSSNVTCGWVCGAICGLASLTFILCFAYLPSMQRLAPHSNTREIIIPDEPFVQVGKLHVLPDLVEENTVFRRNTFAANNTYFINIPDTGASNEMVERLNSVIADYPLIENGEIPEPYVPCYLENPLPNRPCYFNPKWLGKACSSANSFGYLDGDVINPCFILRLEETGDWKPWIAEPSENVYWKDIYDPAFVSVHCEKPRNDQGAIDGVEVFPRKGFPLNFFPASKFDEHYRMPMVIVQVKGLKAGDAVTLECWTRAKNSYELEYSGRVTVRIAYMMMSDATTAPVMSTTMIPSDTS